MDMLLRRDNLDIDIVIEGDGIVFAKEFAWRQGFKVRTHERFQDGGTYNAGRFSGGRGHRQA